MQEGPKVVTAISTVALMPAEGIRAIPSSHLPVPRDILRAQDPLATIDSLSQLTRVQLVTLTRTSSL